MLRVKAEREDFERRLFERFSQQAQYSTPDDVFWVRLPHWGERRGGWATISKPLGPPPDPPPPLRQPVATFAELWRYKHRGLLSGTYREYEHGFHLEFGHRPGTKPGPVENPYYGYEKQAVGRPPKPDKLSNAAKQKAYRARKKQRDKLLLETTALTGDATDVSSDPQRHTAAMDRCREQKDANPKTRPTPK